MPEIYSLSFSHLYRKSVYLRPVFSSFTVRKREESESIGTRVQQIRFLARLVFWREKGEPEFRKMSSQLVNSANDHGFSKYQNNSKIPVIVMWRWGTIKKSRTKDGNICKNWCQQKALLAQESALKQHIINKLPILCRRSRVHLCPNWGVATGQESSKSIGFSDFLPNLKHQNVFLKGHSFLFRILG